MNSCAVIAAAMFTLCLCMPIAYAVVSNSRHQKKFNDMCERYRVLGMNRHAICYTFGMERIRILNLLFQQGVKDDEIFCGCSKITYWTKSSRPLVVVGRC